MPPKSSQQPSVSQFFARVPSSSASASSSAAHAPSAPKRKSSTAPSSGPVILSDSSSDSDIDVPPSRQPPPSKKPKLEAPEPASHSPAPAPAPAPVPKHKKPLVSGRDVLQRYKHVRRSDGDDPMGGGSPPPALTEEEERAKRERHEAFQRVFLGPGNPLRRRDAEAEEGQESEEAGAAQEEEQEGSPSGMFSQYAAAGEGAGGKGGKATEKGKGKGKGKEMGNGIKYTPMEKQILQLKAKYPGTLLIIEVGYKFKFFEEDAKIASKELGIVCFKDRNLFSAMIPVHRMPVRVKKLISAGYKVGIVRQKETAALKAAGSNRSAPFIRELTELYTPATFIDDLAVADDVDPLGLHSAPPTNALVCLVEELKGGMGADERVEVGLVSIVPSTGDLSWDEFTDTHMRTELETRMLHIQPVELLLPSEKMSKTTEKMLAHFAGQGIASSASERIRVERIDSAKYNAAMTFLTHFYTCKNGTASGSSQPVSSQPGTSRGAELLATVSNLPHKVIIALASVIRHLQGFGLDEILRESKFINKFSSRSHMLLHANTLTNLEIFKSSEGTDKGSLMWLLSHTKTRFGRRLLREWVGRPLIDVDALRARIEAVEELLHGDETPMLDKLRKILQGTPDLSKGLARIAYGRATPNEVASVLTNFERISKTFDSSSPDPFKSGILNDVVAVLPTLRARVAALTAQIDLRKARAWKRDTEENKADLWFDPEKYPSIADAKDCIALVEHELQEHLKEVRKIVKKPALEYMSVSGIDFLIEIRTTEAKKAPASWVKISSTKTQSRYHSPEIVRLTKERNQHVERLAAEANDAFIKFQTEISESYEMFRSAVLKLATLDCLLSLATVALQPGYCKPEFVDDDRLEIVAGRHPMAESVSSAPFVPNDIYLGDESGARTLLVTGPNAGGKSSFTRMTALLVILAQIGSYVPADSVKLGIHDAVLTRMGAYDEIARGRSTFMVEMSETSEILKTATSRSLVILDELGRGTATFDGMSIASAVLETLTNRNVQLLFITHLWSLTESEKKFDGKLINTSMAYHEEVDGEGEKQLTFLYKVRPGTASRSYGIECARICGLPAPVLAKAQDASKKMEEETEERQKLRRTQRFLAAAAQAVKSGSSEKLEEMKQIVEG